MMDQPFGLPIGEQMRKNRIRTGYFFVLFPVLILVLTYAGLLIAALFGGKDQVQFSALTIANESMKTVGFWVIVGVFVYSLISYFWGSKMILAFAGAKPIEKKDNPELYRLVENLSIAAGLPKTPDIFIIADESLNAFATGNGPKDAKVAISSGLLAKLEKPELEAVMAHEIGHILNRDIRVMLLAVTLVGAIEMIGEVLIRVRSGDDKKGNPLFFVGLLFLTIGLLVAALTKMAISREREYLADTTSAYLTSNPKALASALSKIAKDARLEILDTKTSMAGLCIADPTHVAHLNNGQEKKSGGFVALWRNAWSSHPPIEKRIEKLGGL